MTSRLHTTTHKRSTADPCRRRQIMGQDNETLSEERGEYVEQGPFWDVSTPLHVEHGETDAGAGLDQLILRGSGL